jgi:hypothetical protein
MLPSELNVTKMPLYISLIKCLEINRNEFCYCYNNLKTVSLSRRTLHKHPCLDREWNAIPVSTGPRPYKTHFHKRDTLCLVKGMYKQMRKHWIIIYEGMNEHAGWAMEHYTTTNSTLWRPASLYSFRAQRTRNRCAQRMCVVWVHLPTEETKRQWIKM